MADGEVIIDIDADTKKLEEETEKKLKEISRKKAELNLQIKDNAQIKSNLLEIRNSIKEINNPSPETLKTYEKLFNVFSEGQKKVFLLTNQIKGLTQEYNQLLNAGNAQRLTSNLNNLNKSLSVSNILTSMFGRRIYNLLRNAFVFNVFMRGFQGLSRLLGNLINRDTILAKTLMVIRANLIRAFAPVWQIVLPIIRALGEGIVWITNQLIRFINFLTGKKIKPLEIKDWREAKQVVGDFYKEVSPKKELFPELKLKEQVEPTKKIRNNTKKTKDNLKNASKESNRLLASFDKLEVLNKGKPFAEDKLESLKFGIDGDLKDELANIEKDQINLKVDEPSIEHQIFDAINRIDNAPLDFNVNDNIDDQIMSQVNGMELPTLDFKVNDEASGKISNIKSKLSEFNRVYENTINWFKNNQWVWKVLAAGIAAVGGALLYANIGGMLKGISKAFGIFLKSIGGFMQLFAGPGGWVALIIGALTLMVLNWDKVREAAIKCCEFIKNNVAPSFMPFINILKAVKALVDFTIGSFNKLLSLIGRGVSKFGDWLGGILGINTEINESSFDRSVSSKSIPHLAQGSVLRGGDPFLAYLNDQPRGQTNIEAPLSTIVDAFKEAISETGYTQSPQINITSNGSMSELIRMLNLKIQDEQIRVGNNFVKGI